MPSYQLKRTYQVGYQPPSKRRRMSKPKLVRSLALAKPEIKDVVLTRTIDEIFAGEINCAGLFGAISQGVSGSTRIGDRIRVLSIEVCGNVFGTSGYTTFSVVCPNRADRVPIRADFGASVGALYDHSNGWNLMHYLRDPSNFDVLQRTTYKFPLGMVVHYDQPNEDEPLGNVSKNEVYLCHIPDPSNDAAQIKYNVRIRFVDA